MARTYGVTQHIPSGTLYLVVADTTQATTGYVEVEQRDVYDRETGTYHLPAHPENYAPVADSAEDAAWLAEQELRLLASDDQDTHAPQMQNHSLAEIRGVIEDGFDPSGILTSADDPEETLRQIDALAVQADGHLTELTYQDMVEYLKWLGTQGR